MQVLPAIQHDARAVADIQVRAWQTFAGIVDDSYLAALSVDKYEDMWRRLIEARVPQLRVAKDSGPVLGWLVFGASREAEARADEGEIWAIHVDPSQWGRGVGRHLWLDARQQMLELALASVSLWTFEANTRAGSFYRALGFTVDPGASRQTTLGVSRVSEIRYVRSVSSAA